MTVDGKVGSQTWKSLLSSDSTSANIVPNRTWTYPTSNKSKSISVYSELTSRSNDVSEPNPEFKVATDELDEISTNSNNDNTNVDNGSIGISDFSKALGFVSKVNGVAVEVIIKTDSPKIIRVINAISNPIGSSNTLNLVDDALNAGALGVKALTGAKTVSDGRAILFVTDTIGGIGKAVGYIGVAIMPITEVGTSIGLYEEDLALAAQYGTKWELNEVIFLSTVGAIADASSWGFGRSIAKTPSSLVRLIPGEDPAWTDTWDNIINEYINSRSFHENVLDPIWQVIVK